MNNHDRGEKRECPNCGAKFYDLGRKTLDCPKCRTKISIDSLNKESVLSKRTIKNNIEVEQNEAENNDIIETFDDALEESEENTSTIVNID